MTLIYNIIFCSILYSLQNSQSLLLQYTILIRSVKQTNSKITKKKEKNLILILPVKKRKLTNLILKVLSIRNQIQEQSSISQITYKKILAI